MGPRPLGERRQTRTSVGPGLVSRQGQGPLDSTYVENSPRHGAAPAWPTGPADSTCGADRNERPMRRFRAESSRAALRNGSWKFVGLALGTANSLRHRFAGYRTPRVFPPSDVGRAVDYAQFVVQRWVEQGLDPAGRHIVELGPGNDLGTGLLLLARGAASYTAVDRFDLLSQTDPRFNAELAAICGVDLDDALNRISYHVTTFPEMPALTGPFDTVLSSAALEHFDDVPATMARLSELTVPGTFHCHLIDPKAHMRWLRDRDPWNLLRYSDRTYRSLLRYPGSPNRLLASDFVTIAQAQGIETELRNYQAAPDEYIKWCSHGLHARFRSRDQDLHQPMFWLVGHRAQVDGASSDNVGPTGGT